MVSTLSYPIITALLLLVAAAAFTDVRKRRIPNALTLAGIVTGLVLHSALGGWSGLRFSAAGMAAGFGLYLLLYATRAMGAGDVKLMAAVGALTGANTWLMIFLATSLVGGVAALVLTAYKHRLQTTLWNVAFIISELMQLRAPFIKRSALDVKDPNALTLPHAVSIALGTVICLLWTSFR
jgi:prepilin peptidase CpaA